MNDQSTSLGANNSAQTTQKEVAHNSQSQIASSCDADVAKKIDAMKKARAYYKQVAKLQNQIKAQEKVILTAQTKIKNYNNKLALLVNDF